MLAKDHDMTMHLLADLSLKRIIKRYASEVYATYKLNAHEVSKLSTFKRELNIITIGIPFASFNSLVMTMIIPVVIGLQI
jgi:hypothetical protein